MPARPPLPTRLSNPPNPWRGTTVDWLGEVPEVSLEVYEDQSRSILSRNESPDVPFRWSVNPYRGCYHGCAYCYARPTHEYLDFGAGTDFERKLVVKKGAAELLRAAFERPSWTGELVAFSGNTDCYQPLEASLGLTRACLEVCLEYRNPVGIVTKSTLVRRDIDLLVALNVQASCSVSVSVPFAEAAKAKGLEPYVASPARRIETIAALARAGLRVGVNLAPVIPGLNDEDIPTILERARQAGASFAGLILLRLPGPVASVFEERLRAAFPDRAERVLSQIRACRGGRLSDPRVGRRMSGQGERWAAIEALFRAAARRLGYESGSSPVAPSPFRRPARGGQLDLWS